MARKRKHQPPPPPSGAPAPAPPDRPAGGGPPPPAAAPPQALPDWRDQFPAVMLVLALVAVIYGQTWNFGYALDDTISITDNKLVQQGIKAVPELLTSDLFKGMLGENLQGVLAGGRYRPLSLVTFALEYEIAGGLNPGLSHILNAVLYAAFCVALLFVLTRLLGESRETPWWRRVSVWATILFVVHPVHVEVVANIKSRDEMLSLGLSTLAIGALLRGWDLRRPEWLLAVPPLYALALLGKESAITFLAPVPIALWLFRSARPLRALLWSLPFILTAIAYLVWRQHLMGPIDTTAVSRDLMNDPFVEMTAPQKFATIAWCLFMYLKLLVVPHPLTHDYYPYQIPIVGTGSLRFLAGVLSQAALAGAGIWLLARKHLLGFAIAWYVATLSIYSNIVFGIGTFINERFLYIPSVGFCLAFAWGALQLASRIPMRALLAGLSLIAVLFTVRSATRVPDWRNGQTLNEAAVRVSVNSARAQHFRGYDLYRAVVENRVPPGEVEATLTLSLEHVDRALAIHPTYGEALKARAGILGQRYQMDGDLGRLLAGFEELLKVRHVAFIDEYLDYLEKRQPGNEVLTAFCRRVGYDHFGMKLGNWPLAERYLLRAYRLQPRQPGLLIQLVNTTSRLGKQADLLRFAREARDADPTNEEVRALLERLEGVADADG